MRRILARKGLNARAVGDGEAALRMLAESPADVALVDISLPEIDGVSLTEQIARRFEGRIVVVITSALASVESAVEVTRRGAFDFLVKPFTPDNLICVVERAGQQWRLIREREKYLSELAGSATSPTR